jgi:TRAP transporter TAXI family solute receptor
MHKLFACLLTAAMLFMGVAADAVAADIKFFKILSTVPGGSWHTQGTHLADVLQKQIPEITFNHSAGGTDRNNHLVSSNQAQMAFTFVPSANEAYNSRGLYEGREPAQNVAYLGTQSAFFIHPVVRKGVEVSHINQLKDKALSPGRRVWFTAWVASQILDAFGINAQSVEQAGGTMHYLGLKDARSMMQDRRLDAFMYYSSVPSPLMWSLAENPGISIPAYTEQDVDMLLEKLEPKGAFTKLNYPENAYKGVKGGFPCPVMWAIFIVNKDLPEDLVYKITKVIYETKSLRDLAGGGTSYSYEWATHSLKDGPIPIHPGAVRYYKEKGVW